MIKIRPVLLLIILFTLIVRKTNGQITIQSNVIDIETKKGIPYTYIYLSGQPVGYSDSLGFFSLKLSPAKTDSDTLYFSCVGYERTGFVLRDLLTTHQVLMKPRVNILQEVVVKKQLSKEVLVIGPPRRINSWNSLCNDSSWGMILANYFSFLDTTKSFLLIKIEVFILEKGDSPIRLRVLSRDTQKKYLVPDKELIAASIFFKTYKKGWNTFELSEPVLISDHEFFIGVEIIKNFTQESQKKSKQCIGFTKSDYNGVFGSDALRRWSSSNALFKGESPMVRAYVTVN